jgi:hypothetical protein
MNNNNEVKPSNATAVEDGSVSESHGSMTEQTNKSVTTMSVDKDIRRTKSVAFFVLGLAAVGLAVMTFFLTRSEELNDFESQVCSFPSRICTDRAFLGDLLSCFAHCEQIIHSLTTTPTS